MPKKISAVKIRRTFTPERRLALMLIIGSVTFVLTERISAETPYEHASPAWLKRLLGASAAGLVAGFTVTFFMRRHSHKLK